MAENYLAPNDPNVELFTSLQIGEVVDFPIGALSLTVVEDWTNSHTDGAIEAYALRVSANGPAEHIGKIAIWVGDGNHRCLERLRKGHTTIPTTRVVPREEHDIRVMFDAEDKWEEI